MMTSRILNRTGVLLLATLTSHWAMGQATNFNRDWKLFVGDSPQASGTALVDNDWKPVTLPHAFNEDDAFKKDIAELSTGISWYRKTFELSADAVAGKVFLEFQGARFGAEVFINGKSAGLYENGVMAFGVDLTGKVVAGKNVVAVRVDNAWNYKERATGSNYQWNDRNFYANYGGINKNVVLHLKPKVYQTLPLFSSLGTTGVYVYATDMDVASKSARVTIESQVKNDDIASQNVVLETVIRDLDGKQVGTAKSDVTSLGAGETKVLTAKWNAAGLNFWSWGYGYLYTVETRLIVDGKPGDTVETKTGFRKTEFASGALKLNGRTLHLKGYAQRTTNEWPALGINIPPWLSDYSNGLMVESGGSLVRWMHVTPSKQDVESCDRVGLIQAMPAGDSEKDTDGRKWQQRIEVMRDAIIYNRNNPSILFYEAGNKGISENHMSEMVALKNEFDPHGGRAMGCREMLGSSIAEWGGEMLYINKSAAKPVWATEYSRDEALRKYADELTPPFHKDGSGPEHKGESAASYNRNQDSMAIETVKRWYDFYAERPGTGKRVNGGAVNIIFSDSNTHHRGAENYRRSGEVDAMRILKEGYFAHKVMWDGWVNPDKITAHIVGHWNYPSGTIKNVTVISPAAKTELLLNGKSIGTATPTFGFLHTFKDVAFAPGTLTAIGFDTAGKKICETHITTAGAPTAIKLTPIVSPTGLSADGSDLFLVNVEIVDANGQRCPTAFDLIDFKLSGPAEWRGGIAQSEGNYILSQKLPVELGVNRVSIRSTTTPGTITVEATSGNLKPATVSVTSAAVNPDAIPGAGLKPTLSRGPTPTGDSVVPTRKPLTVAKVTAGSNMEDVEKSLDDNEETSWANDGKLSTAWITYELDQPSTLSEITLKLAAWRTRSYPIRVLVDNKEVYVGATPRSLGYVTLPVTPMTGKKVTIKLLANPSDRDDFNMLEVTGKKLTEGTTDSSNAKGTLKIIEAELYGPVK